MVPISYIPITHGPFILRKLIIQKLLVPVIPIRISSQTPNWKLKECNKFTIIIDSIIF